MPESETVSFVDRDSGQPAFALVRTAGGFIGLAVSLKDDGDIEVFLDAAEAERLADALHRAVETVHEPR